jgi:hypothetical protein
MPRPPNCVLTRTGTSAETAIDRTDHRYVPALSGVQRGAARMSPKWAAV